MNNVHADEVGGRTVYRFGTATPLTAGDGPPAAAPLPPSEVPIMTSRPMSPALTLPIPMPEENVNTEAPTSRPPSSASRTTLDSHSRFSTVVHRAEHAATDQHSRSLDDLRQLPDMAIVPAVEDEPAHHIMRTTHYPRRVSDDERISREAEALLHDAEDLNRRVLEVLRPETLDSGDSQPTPSPSRPEPSREGTNVLAPPPPPPEVVHDADPPFLTDGRGRVVWSSTTAGRHHRESRRGRSGASAAVSTQQKMRREMSDTDVVVARAVEGSAQGDMGRGRTSSRPRHLPRAVSDPEDIRSRSVEDDGSGTFVSGHRAVSGDMPSVVTSTPESADTPEQSVPAATDAIDGHSEQSGSEGSASGRDSEGRSLLGRLFGAVLSL